MHFTFRLTLTYILLIATVIYASPICRKKQGVVTFRTVHTSTTKDGVVVTETCDITLTPITNGAKSHTVEEVRKCSLKIAIQERPNHSGTASSSIVRQSTSTVTSTSHSRPASTSSITGGLPLPTSASPTSTPASNSPVTEVEPQPTSDLPATTLSASPLPAGTAKSESNATKAAATASPDSSASAAAAFQLPGKKLSVLPIGLGVFAGISVIALIVVGLVTYERTKYRKAFRQRKLAEAGATMGYGGMAQRPW